MGIEPTRRTWQAHRLPLHHTRIKKDDEHLSNLFHLWWIGNLVPDSGIEPLRSAYETNRLPLHQSGIDTDTLHHK